LNWGIGRAGCWIIYAPNLPAYPLPVITELSQHYGQFQANSSKGHIKVMEHGQSIAFNVAEIPIFSYNALTINAL